MTDTKSATRHNSEQSIDLKLLVPKMRQSINFKLVTECIVGSDATSDLVIDDATIAAKHLRLFVSELFDVFIEPIADATVALNGSIVQNPVCIKDGDWVVLGSTPYQILLDASHITASTQTSINEDKSAGIDLTTKSLVTIGRSGQCDIVIPSPLVSRLHATLTKQPSGWIIEDNGSTNGTFINAQRIQGKQQLEASDYVAIAAFEYIFTGDRLETSRG